jgi:hypothetical protein
MEKLEASLIEFDVQTLIENLIKCYRMRWNICVRVKTDAYRVVVEET